MDELQSIRFEQAMSEIRLCVEHERFETALLCVMDLAMSLTASASGESFAAGQRAAEHFAEDFRASQEFSELLRAHRVEWTGKWARAFQAQRAAEAASMEAAA